MPEHTCMCKSVGNLVNMSMYICTCVGVCIYVYVYEHDRFMYVHMCIHCVCVYFMTIYSAVRIPIVSNCAIYIRFFITTIIKPSTTCYLNPLPPPSTCSLKFIIIIIIVIIIIFFFILFFLFIIIIIISIDAEKQVPLPRR